MIFRKLAIVMLALSSPVWGQLPAFPGAEGFGAFATGGRGGRVVYVTNLNTSGPGSFQWALDQVGPRYILFKVSGLINGAVHLTSSDVTIAGQTSPGGIIVRGFHTTEEPYTDQVLGRINDPDVKHAENWILRHIRSRPAGAGLNDGLRARYTKNAIIDHCSIANARDEAFELSFSTGVTIQNCMLSETLGGHAQYGGMLINYSNPADGFPLTQFSIHHNLWNRIDGRMPEVARDSPAAGGTTMDIELADRLVTGGGGNRAPSANAGPQPQESESLDCPCLGERRRCDSRGGNGMMETRRVDAGSADDNYLSRLMSREWYAAWQGFCSSGWR